MTQQEIIKEITARGYCLQVQPITKVREDFVSKIDGSIHREFPAMSTTPKDWKFLEKLIKEGNLKDIRKTK